MRQQTIITRTALAAVLATSMAAAPLAAGAQQQTAQTQPEALYAAAATASATATASSAKTVQLDSPLDGVDAWTGSDELNTSIIEQAQAADLAGCDALARYLNGEAVAAADFAAIDVDALALIDEDLALHVKQTQAALAAASTPSEPQPTEPAAPSKTPSAPAEQPSDSAAAEQDQADDVVDAPDDVVQKSETLEEDEIAYIERNQTTEQFIESIGEDARKLAHDNDLYASVMIAQAVVESASGSSGLSCEPYNNLFGIKGSYDGKSVRMKTQEDDGEGNLETIVAEFRRYPSLLESLEDYVGLLTGNSLYDPVKKSNTNSYEDACSYLQGRYATSSTYARTLEAYIEAYDLTRYDKLADEASTEAATLDKVLKPTKTHAVFAKDSDAFGIEVPEEGLPARPMSPVLAGLLAAAGAAALGGLGYWLYWRRKVVADRAAELAGEAEPAAADEPTEQDGAWSVDQAVREWSPKHAAVGGFGKHAAMGSCFDAEAEPAANAATASEEDPTDPMEPLK